MSELHFRTFIAIAGVALLLSCQSQTGDSRNQQNATERQQEDQRSSRNEQQRENLIRYNQKLKNLEERNIRDFIEASGLPYILSGSQAIYTAILEKGNGPKIQEGQKITIHSQMSDLKGNRLENDRFFDVIVNGDSEATLGLQDVLMTAHIGDSLTCVIPSKEAYGVTGYNSIPPYTTIVYYLRILQ